MDTELPDEQTYAAFTLWEEFGEGSTRGRIAANSLLKSLFPLEDLGNRIDTWIRPQAETMHKILHRFVDNPAGCVTFHASSSILSQYRYILCPRSTDPKEAADQAVASHAAHEFFLKVMLWHKTFSSRGNKLFALSFLRIHFDRDLKEDFSGSRHFWELLLRALDLMIQEKGKKAQHLVLEMENWDCLF